MAGDSDKKEKKRRESKVELPVDIDVTMEDSVEGKKAKKDKDEIVIPAEALSPIAHPLAGKKLSKKVHKVVKKAAKHRQVKRGVKEVVKSIRKGEKGLLVLAADITPIDIISHLPVLSEEASIPYIFVRSKEGLGQASSTKRPTSCVLICPDSKKKAPKDGEAIEEEDYREIYNECFEEVKELDDKILF